MSIFSGLVMRSLVGLLGGAAAFSASAAPIFSDAGRADTVHSLSPWIMLGLAALFIGRIVDRSVRPEPPDPDQKPIGRPSRT